MKQATTVLSLVLFAVMSTVGVVHADDGERKPLRAGLIGLDTSHVIAFTNLINAAKDPAKDGDLAYLTVVAGYPGGSPDVTASHTRVEKFTNQLREKGIEIVDSISALLEKVDVVLLESVDGRPHLAQAIPVIKAGKPLFIDKPMAGSLTDVIAIFELAKRHKVPVFSSSSLRYMPGVADARNNKQLGDITGCITWGPCSLEPHHPDLFWYGVHGCEMLFTVMGPGCESVVRVHTPGADIVTGTWSGGRTGVFRGIRTGKSSFGAVIFGSKSIVHVNKYGGYQPLVERIATFFQTHQPPVPATDTIELFAFMQAADESKRLGGKPVDVTDLIAKARAEALKKIAE